MMIITKKHLSRRAILRGAGVAMALPFLDAMHPALSAERKTAAAPIRRFSIVEYPHGVVDDRWNPVGEGANYRISDGLSPLESHRNKFVVFRGLSSDPNRSLPGFHDRAMASFLTGVEMTRGKIQVGISVDQVAAKKFAAETQFASLEVSAQPLSNHGSPCFKDATTMLPFERNPRLVFERLFGDTDKVDPVARAARDADDISILDGVTDTLGDLNRDLGASDRRKMDQYLDSIRDVERRVRIVGSRSSDKLPEMHRPSGIPDKWPDQIRLMFDLQALALQADLTRVMTFLMGQEGSSLNFPHLDISMQWHEISHHNYEKPKLDALAKINKNCSELLAYYLAKLDGIQEPSGSLLDHTIILYGSTLSNPTVHSQHDLPIIVAGGGVARVKGGRFVRMPGDLTPLTNLYLEILNKLGVPTEKLGDSTGPLNRLEA